jgi:hypothetical protein
MKYLGVKLIEAEPMTYFEFANEKYGAIRQDVVDSEGYKVKYSDDYVSFSPKDVFEKAYFPLKHPDGTKILEDDVINFVKDKEASKWGEKTTVLHTTLKNGYVISETSSCVEPENFDMIVGAEICIERTKNKIWELLGFLLQCGRNGVK